MHTGCNIRCSFCVLGSALECANHDDNIGCYLLELLLSEHHDQALSWGNVRARLRWGVSLFSHLFKMLSDHQHQYTQHEQTTGGTPHRANLLKVLGHQGVGPARLFSEMRCDEIGWGYCFHSGLTQGCRITAIHSTSISVSSEEPSLETGSISPD